MAYTNRIIIISFVFCLCARENFWAVNHLRRSKSRTDMAEIVSSCLTQYYDGETNIPDEIIIPCRLPDEEVIIEWLTEKKDKKIVLTVPSIGTKNALLDMANENARNLWEAAHKSRRTKRMRLYKFFRKNYHLQIAAAH